jgi:hypothetical protein
MDARCPGSPRETRRSRQVAGSPPPAGEGAPLLRWARLGPWVVLLGLASVLGGAGLTGCAHEPPVKPWQRGYTARRAMSFDDGLATRFQQHVFSAREGAEGGYGRFSGGCGCN